MAEPNDEEEDEANNDKKDNEEKTNFQNLKLPIVAMFTEKNVSLLWGILPNLVEEMEAKLKKLEAKNISIIFVAYIQDNNILI